MPQRRKQIAVKTGKRKTNPSMGRRVLRPVKKGTSRKSQKRKFSLFAFLRPLVVRFMALSLITALNLAGISSIGYTVANLMDSEDSAGNTFDAALLDFELTSVVDFTPNGITTGEITARSIDFINHGDNPEYKISATEITGDACPYLNLTANLNGDNAEYPAGALSGFVERGPFVFAGPPENWVFSLSLRDGLEDSLIKSIEGQNCRFKLIFSGSQTANDLPFMQGLNDTEEVSNTVAIKACEDYEIRSMGYWKNHSEIYAKLLPQTLDNDVLILTNKVKQVFLDYNLSMRNKLRGQLLAMKFNVEHFGSGIVVDEISGKTLSEIVIEADNLLKNASAQDSELEAMKNVLDRLNNLETVRFCHLPAVKVLVPNGGEVWWVGRSYDLTWTSFNLSCETGNVLVDLFYSGDGGITFTQIASGTENDGIYNWRVPLVNNGYYMVSERARLRAVARCDTVILGWDMSDRNFCPPIDFDLLTPEEIEMLGSFGIMYEPTVEPANDPASFSEEFTQEEIAVEESLIGGGSIVEQNTEMMQEAVASSISEPIELPTEIAVGASASEMIEPVPEEQTTEDSATAEDNQVPPVVDENALEILKNPATTIEPAFVESPAESVLPSPRDPPAPEPTSEIPVE